MDDNLYSVTRKCISALVAVFGLGFPSGAATVLVTETLSATLNPTGKLSVPASVALTHAGTIFNPYTGVLTLSYRARTVNGGSITLKATSDFAPGGPSIASGNLQYTCSGATMGTACAGGITASTSTSTPVLTLPASSCTGASCGNSDPNTVTIGVTLADSPASKTGSYSANVQFTISST